MLQIHYIECTQYTVSTFGNVLKELKNLSTSAPDEPRGSAGEGPDGWGGAEAGRGGDAGGGEPVHQELPLSLLIRDGQVV